MDSLSATIDEKYLKLSFVIYKITNMINGKVYIGLTSKTLERRLLNHETHVRNGYRNHFYNSIRKHGWSKFKCDVIEQVNDKDSDRRVEKLKDRERYWISHFRSFIGFDDCNGYNSTLGGDGSWGRIASDETREKISKKITGMFSGERNHCWGKFGEEHPAFGRENKWGSHTEDTKKRIGKANIGENNCNYGKHGANHHASKAVVALDKEGKLVKLYESIVDGANDVNGHYQSIVAVCKGRRKTASGYKWMYKDDYENTLVEA